MFAVSKEEGEKGMMKTIQELYINCGCLLDAYKYRYSTEEGLAWECDLCLAVVARLGHRPQC